MRFWHLLSWIMLLGAAAFASESIILLATPSTGLAQGVISLIDSGLFTLAGMSARRNWRQARGNLTKALQSNRDEPALDT